MRPLLGGAQVLFMPFVIFSQFDVRRDILKTSRGDLHPDIGSFFFALLLFEQGGELVQNLVVKFKGGIEGWVAAATIAVAPDTAMSPSKACLAGYDKRPEPSRGHHHAANNPGKGQVS